MARITDYASLVASIVRRLADANVADNMDEFIQLTEAEINRRLFTIEGEVTATTATVAGDSTLAFPARFKKIRSIKIGSGPTNILTQLSVDDLDAKWADASNAKPENYAIVDSQIKLGPAPDDVYTATIVCVQGVYPLSATNTTNWLLEDHPDAYVAGCTAHAEVDGWNDERAAGVIDPLFQRIVQQIREADAIKRKGDLVGDVAACYF